MSAYLRFAQTERVKLVKDNPSLKASQIMSMLGGKWSNLSEEEKQKYVEEYKQELPKYSQILADYKASLSPEDVEAIKKAKLAKELKKEKRDKRERVKDLGKPKKPATPFLSFIMGRAQKGITPLAYAQRCKEFAKEWKALSDEEKKPLIDKFETEKQKYEKELAKWEQKMIKMGNTDVVRLNTLKNSKTV